MLFGGIVLKTPLIYNVFVRKKQTLLNEKGVFIMNKKDLLKGIVISIITLGAGYAAMIIPFNLFLTVSKDGQRIFFIIELCVYLTVGTIFLLIQDKKEKQIQKEKARHKEREKKINDVKENWYNIAA